MPPIAPPAPRREITGARLEEASTVGATRPSRPLIENLEDL